MALFAIKYTNIKLPHQFGAKQGSELAFPSSNVVASFKSKVFFPPSQLPYSPLVDGYTFLFHTQDTCSTAKHLILIIQSYCDNDTQYTAVILLDHLITYVQWSLYRVRYFSLVIKKQVSNTRNVQL